MEAIKKLLCKVKTLMSRRNEKHSRTKTAVIVSVVVTAAAVGVAAGSVSAKNADAGQGTAAADVPKQEQLSDPDEDPEPAGAAEATVQPEEEETVPQGFQGIIDGVNATKAANGEYHPIGTNVEDVLVGQRTAIREEVSEFDVGSLVKETVNSIDDQSWELVEKTKISDNDYETLLSIVEAEAGGEDIMGRILVANVIFNRVASDQFPDSVTEVVWDKSGGSAQFSPTIDGRIATVSVSDTTREAVNRAIDGEDYSDGALFFLEKEYSEAKNVKWFDSKLTFLFKHGCHSFYKY